MGMFDWLKGQPKTKSAMVLYKSGIKKAGKRDHDGAIQDYSDAIELSTASDKEKAMALYNRALVYHAVKENDKAIDDLNSVLTMHSAHSDIKSAATKKLERIKLRTGQKT
jgi:tetratricopeptide (TPR) repeat protein